MPPLCACQQCRRACRRLVEASGHALARLLDGRIVGGWAVDGEGRVVSRLLEDVDRAGAAGIEAEVERLQTWLDGVAVTPRFRTPLEKELTG